MFSRTRIIAPVLLALLVAGCGGSGQDSGSHEETAETAGPITINTTSAKRTPVAQKAKATPAEKAKLVERARRICGEANGAIYELEKQGKGGNSPSEANVITEYYAGMADLLGIAIRQEGGKESAKLLAADGDLEETANEAKADFHFNKGRAALKAAEAREAAALARFHKVAAESGFKACSEGPGPWAPGIPRPGSPNSVESEFEQEAVEAKEPEK